MVKNWNVRQEAGVVFLVAAFVLLFRLGGVPLLDPDEPVYAQTAVEMLEAGDFVSPRIYGDFWYDKPPLYYWLTAASVAALGPTETAARLPSALFGIAGALGVYFAGRGMLGRRAAFLGALVLATSFEYVYLGKAAVTDMALTFFFGGALFAYYYGRYGWMYVSMGLAVLTKGPVGVVLPGAIIALHLLLCGRLREIGRLRPLRGLGLLALVAGPWYLAMYALHGAAFVDTFLGFHNVTRFLQPEHASGAKLYYYVPVLLLGFFPWTPFLLQALREAARQRRSAQGEALLLCAVWAGVVLAFFSASQTKLVSYILPLYPALALLVGYYLDRRADVRFTGGIVGVSALSGAIVVALAALAQRRLGYVPEGVWMLLGALVAMTMAAALANYRRRSLQAVFSLVAGMVCFVAVLVQSVLPIAAQFVSVKEPAAAFSAAYRGDAPVYVEKFYRPGFCFYTGEPGEVLDGRFEQLLRADGRAYFLVKEGNYEALPKEEREKLTVLRRQAGILLAWKR